MRRNLPSVVIIEINKSTDNEIVSSRHNFSYFEGIILTLCYMYQYTIHNAFINKILAVSNYYVCMILNETLYLM